jgi:DNA-binding XRE family transcriptional regulator
MSATRPTSSKKETEWTPTLIKMLRGKRSQSSFGELIGVPKNTVWRWESGYVKPDSAHATNLSKLAEREHFLQDWQLVGSMKIHGDLEAASDEIRNRFKESLARTASEL